MPLKRTKPPTEVDGWAHAGVDVRYEMMMMAQVVITASSVASTHHERHLVAWDDTPRSSDE